MIDSFRFGDSFRISELCELVEVVQIALQSVSINLEFIKISFVKRMMTFHWIQWLNSTLTASGFVFKQIPLSKRKYRIAKVFQIQLLFLQELRMLSSVTLDCQVTKIVINSSSHCHCHCQVSRVALWMSKVKEPSVSESVSEWVTRSPIELFWTAKKYKSIRKGIYMKQTLIKYYSAVKLSVKQGPCEQIMRVNK